jgi:hypothetical protein
MVLGGGAPVRGAVVLGGGVMLGQLIVGPDCGVPDTIDGAAF